MRTQTGRSAAWLARIVRDDEVGGSNPPAPTHGLYGVGFPNCLVREAFYLGLFPEANGSQIV